MMSGHKEIKSEIIKAANVGGGGQGNHLPVQRRSKKILQDNNE